MKAHTGGSAQTSSSPYSLAYNYDAWGNTTSRQGSHWSTTLPTFATNYVNGRDVNMSYDQAGNVVGYTSTPDPYMHYDAAGKLFTQFESSGGPGIVRVRENFYDGDGAKILHKTSNGSMINGNYDHFCNYYLIRSSVLGGRVIAEFKDLTTLPANDPLKYSSMSYVYLQGVQLAFQQGAHQTTGDKYVVWTYHNPTVGNYFAEYQLNNSSQQQQNILYGEMTFDPLGSFAGLTEQQPLNIPEPFTFSMGQFIDSNTGKCYADYVETSCTIVMAALNNRWGVQAPWGSMAVGMNRFSASDTSFDFIVDWDNGFFGFVPTGMPLTPELVNGQGMWVDPETAMSGSLQSIRGHMPKIGMGQLPEKQKDDPRHQENKSPCSQFVDYLVGVTLSSSQVWPFFSRSYTIELDFLFRARKMVGGQLTHNFGGFKEDLTGKPSDLWGQWGDVYQHVLGFASAYLVGNRGIPGRKGTGWDNIVNQLKDDIHQYNDPVGTGHNQVEALQEIRDDIAGIHVGRSISDYLNLRSPAKTGIGALAHLRQSMFDLLCDR
ncbi:MAG: hypothetical protein AB7H86_19455 [Blastocatellales bacterium]